MGTSRSTQRRGGGTKFTFTVLLAPAEGPGDDHVQRRPRYVIGLFGGLRVLSVEDNPFGRVVLNAILTELGHHAEFVGRGEDAAQRIAQGGFDAVLMDMVLPGISGIEAIRRIRALDAPAGASRSSAFGRSDDEAASRAAGADAFLVKPVFLGL